MDIEGAFSAAPMFKRVMTFRLVVERISRERPSLKINIDVSLVCREGLGGTLIKREK